MPNQVCKPKGNQYIYRGKDSKYTYAFAPVPVRRKSLVVSGHQSEARDKGLDGITEQTDQRRSKHFDRSYKLLRVMSPKAIFADSVYIILPDTTTFRPFCLLHLKLT